MRVTSGCGAGGRQAARSRRRDAAAGPGYGLGWASRRTDPSGVAAVGGRSRTGDPTILLQLRIAACAIFALFLAAPVAAAPTGLGAPIVFVSRQILPDGSIYWDAVKGMPGVGPASRVRPAAPGRLLVLETDGSVRTLVDGAAPGAASLFLVDVNGPAVSYDATWIAFAGLAQGTWNTGAAASVGGWRLYKIRADGTQLAPLTTSDEDDLDLSQHGTAQGALGGYDDFDPVWLPDGRIAFSSTRFRSIAQYSGVRTSNLFIVNANGSGMQRITAERNGADRPLVDPLTGKIVFARWWRNHRFPIDDMSTVTTAVGPIFGYVGTAYAQHLGLTTDRDHPVGGPTMFRNAWQAAAIAPDGTGLEMWSGRFRSEDANNVYGGAFRSDGVLFANYFPMANMTEAAGFGGVRRYQRGPEPYVPVLGVTAVSTDYVHPLNPTSFGIFNGSYAVDPDVLPGGDLIVSSAPDVNQDYGLVRVAPDGSGATPVLDDPGTAELRARVLAPRPLPPVLPPATATASLLPPGGDGPYDGDGTFTFAALNVYANAPVDVDIVSAPPVGSANSIRFFLDHQRQSPGSFAQVDWPILLGERLIAADGSVTEPAAPAWLPLFEQLRSSAPAGYAVPRTGGPYPDGAAHVAGMNYGAPGAVARCVGCHAGHTEIPVPASDEAAKWSNLAPGATLHVSSARDANYTGGLVDRRAKKGEMWRYWNSAAGDQDGAWVALEFPVPVFVRSVRLWNPRAGGEANSTIQVNAATVRLFSDAAGAAQVAAANATAISADGTDVAFADVKARLVRVDLDDVSGSFYGIQLASLAEVEVIAKGAELAPEPADAALGLLSIGVLAALRRGRHRIAR
jgi:hypothetical protein